MVASETPSDFAISVTLREALIMWVIVASCWVFDVRAMLPISVSATISAMRPSTRSDAAEAVDCELTLGGRRERSGHGPDVSGSIARYGALEAAFGFDASLQILGCALLCRSDRWMMS